MFRDLSISNPAKTSSLESPANDTRIVSPIPWYNNIPNPTEDRMEPAWTVPASVIPKCNGYGTISAKLVYASTVVGTSKAFKEIFIWSKSCSSSRLISHKAVATI